MPLRALLDAASLHPVVKVAHVKAAPICALRWTDPAKLSTAGLLLVAAAKLARDFICVFIDNGFVQHLPSFLDGDGTQHGVCGDLQGLEVCA